MKTFFIHNFDYFRYYLYLYIKYIFNLTCGKILNKFSIVLFLENFSFFFEIFEKYLIGKREINLNFYLFSWLNKLVFIFIKIFSKKSCITIVQISFNSFQKRYFHLIQIYIERYELKILIYQFVNLMELYCGIFSCYIFWFLFWILTRKIVIINFKT